MINNNKKEGFSLFELLIVISIIGILTAVVSVAYSGSQKKTRDTRRVEDMKLIQTAAEQYYSQTSYTYPTSATGPWVSGTGDTILAVTPSEPKTSWTDYKYTLPGTGYCVCAAVENVGNGNSDDDLCTFSVGNSGDYFCVKNQQ
ncbi:MAG: type II secretion system protein [Candidatus Shapirobacteria bacterium]|nr:type II secretion system protein [Candidatus Shapirobacteria bacterium]